MQIHTGNQKDDVSLAKEFQHYLTKDHRKNGFINQGKNYKQCMERKWIDRQYHVQDNADFANQEVKMYCKKSNPQNYHFVVHITNLMAQGGWVSIIIYVFIQNLEMVYVKLSVYHVLVLHVHQWLTNFGYLVYHQMNSSAV